MNPRLEYYESYKDHFPKEWEYRKLDKQILDILPGFAFKSEYFSDEKGAPLIRVRDVGQKNTEINYSGDYDEKYLINKNDIIIGMDGIYIIDKWKGPISLLNQRVCKIKSAKNNQLNDDYLYYVIQRPIQKIEKLTPQTTVKHLSTKDIRNIQFPVPPLVEQRGIVEVLGTVDECIRLTDAVIERAEELKRGLMLQLLTKGIEHTEYKETPLGEIPKTWKTVKIGKIVRKLNSGITPRGGAENYVDSGVPFIRSQNVQMNQLDFSDVAYIPQKIHESMKNSVVKPNDVLLNITGASIGRVAYVPEYIDEANVNQHVCRIRFKEDFNPIYMSYFLSSFLGQKQIMSFQAGGTRQGLNFEQLRSMVVPAPSFKEQTKITNILLSIDKKIMYDNMKREYFINSKDGLMQQLLSGKIRVELKGDGLHRIGDGREANIRMA